MDVFFNYFFEFISSLIFELIFLAVFRLDSKSKSLKETSNSAKLSLRFLSLRSSIKNSSTPGHFNAINGFSDNKHSMATVDAPSHLETIMTASQLEKINSGSDEGNNERFLVSLNHHENYSLCYHTN